MNPKKDIDAGKQRIRPKRESVDWWQRGPLAWQLSAGVQKHPGTGQKAPRQVPSRALNWWNTWCVQKSWDEIYKNGESLGFVNNRENKTEKGNNYECQEKENMIWKRKSLLSSWLSSKCCLRVKHMNTEYRSNQNWDSTLLERRGGRAKERAKSSSRYWKVNTQEVTI